MSLLKHITSTCKEASALIDKRAVTKISLIEKLRLSVHKTICAGCTCYEKQSEFLDKIAAKIQNTPIERKLPEEARLRIIEALKKK
jgi:hypothetical protein